MSRAKNLKARIKARAPALAHWPKASRVNGKPAARFAARLRLAIHDLSERLAAYSSARHPEFLEIPAIALRAQSAARRKG
ncbi:hypothetical protein [Phenylobacterium sp.]|uniref:hypothetical protein n=1 Tax=Phenylobacterium sp. TaxID=1871053 RepID=UPI002C738CEE|nr:hypothetical protein [Phenylobacterium sp.]HVI30627.1 hypothetical protein [Phenylobacterium sp.]